MRKEIRRKLKKLENKILLSEIVCMTCLVALVFGLYLYWDALKLYSAIGALLSGYHTLVLDNIREDVTSWLK